MPKDKPLVIVMGEEPDWLDGRGKYLLEDVDYSDEGCWLKTKYIQKNGACRLRLGTKRQEFAHIAAYAEWVASIPRGQRVNQWCDNKNCINPWHLYLSGDPLADRLRFESNLERYGDCLVWMGYTMPFGHGQINIRGDAVLTHRYAWELANGPIPEGLDVCHHCDNPPCCNVEHLFLGTEEMNLADMAWKERSGTAKLTAITACEVRERYARGGETLQELANEFKVSKRAVLNTVHGKTWLHAGGPILKSMGDNGWTRRRRPCG